MASTGLTGVFGFHRQVGANQPAKGPYNATAADCTQVVTLTGASSGAFKLKFRDEVTADIAFDALAATVETALEALDAIAASGDVAVSGSAGGPYTIVWSGTWADNAVGVEIYSDTLNAGATVEAETTVYGGNWYWLPALSVNFQPNQIVQAIPPEVGGDLWSRGSYKGGVSGQGQVMFIPRGGLGLAELFLAFAGTFLTTTTSAVEYAAKGNEVQLLTVDATGGTFTLTYDGQTTAAIAENAAASAVQSALVALSNIGTSDVSVTGSAGGPWEIEFTGTLANTDVALITTGAGSLTGGAGTAVIATIQDGGVGAGANKLIGNGSNGISAGNFKYRFTPQTGIAAELPWYTLIRNVSGKFVEEFQDSRLGNFAFDIAATNLLQVDASFISRKCGTLALTSGGSNGQRVGTQTAGNGRPFQAVDATIKLDTNVAGVSSAVAVDADLNPTRINVGFANQLSSNEFTVGSFFLQDITNQSRTANVTFSVYLKNPDLYSRTYAHGVDITTSDADWSSEIWKGAMELTLTGHYITGSSGDRYSIKVTIPEMDYMATPIALAGNNLVEYQLTTNVVLSQTSGISPFEIEYVTNENILY